MANILQEKGLFLVYSKNVFFFTWKIEQSSQNKVSSRFNLGLGGTDSFLSIGYAEQIALYLYLKYPVTEIKGNFCMFVSDAKNEIFHQEIKSDYSFPVSYDSFLNWKRVDLLENYDKPLPSSAKLPLTVTCIWNSVAFHDLPLTIENENVGDTVLFSNLKQLSSDFKKILDQNTNSDVVLKVEESNIRAHKLILQARSTVFNKMFDNDTLEAATNEVVIPDLGAATVQRLLHYLYTGTVEKCNFQETIDLYGAADKYEVLSLRDICKTELSNHLQADNACLVFDLANSHDDEDLKQRAVQFIRADFMSVVQTNSFEELSKEDVILLTRLCASAMVDKTKAANKKLSTSEPSN